MDFAAFSPPNKAQSALLPLPDEHSIGPDPEARGGTIEVALGEEGVKERLGAGPLGLASLYPSYALCNSDAAVQLREDSHSIESLD